MREREREIEIEREREKERTNGIHKIIRRNYHLVYYVTKVSNI